MGRRLRRKLRTKAHFRGCRPPPRGDAEVMWAVYRFLAKRLPLGDLDPPQLAGAARADPGGRIVERAVPQCWHGRRAVIKVGSSCDNRAVARCGSEFAGWAQDSPCMIGQQ